MRTRGLSGLAKGHPAIQWQSLDSTLHKGGEGPELNLEEWMALCSVKTGEDISCWEGDVHRDTLIQKFYASMPSTEARVETEKGLS